MYLKLSDLLDKYLENTFKVFQGGELSFLRKRP